ncbi:Ras-related protein Rab [Acrasis kona]|uniref:Ras-related protein Rab n=1 Tax=Acrasis kona TaxID=1008807 RepID=A0AAW2ZC20_9EUKA
MASIVSKTAITLSSINLSMKRSLRNLKILVLGNPGVGKTSIIKEFICGSFQNDYEPTLGVDFASRSIALSEEAEDRLNMNIVDTAGDERYQGLSVSYFRNVDVCVLVFDCTDRSSFESLDKWKDEFIIQAGLSLDNDEYPFVVLCNKIDLSHERVTTDIEAQAWCQKQHQSFTYMEVSAKWSHENEDDNIKVDNVFVQIAEKALTSNIEWSNSSGKQNKHTLLVGKKKKPRKIDEDNQQTPTTNYIEQPFDSGFCSKCCIIL